MLKSLPAAVVLAVLVVVLSYPHFDSNAYFDQELLLLVPPPDVFLRPPALVSPYFPAPVPPP